MHLCIGFVCSYISMTIDNKPGSGPASTHVTYKSARQFYNWPDQLPPLQECGGVQDGFQQD